MISLYINLRLSSFFRCRVSDMHVTDGQTDGLTDGEHCLLRTAAPVAPGQFIPPFYMVLDIFCSASTSPPSADL